MAVTKTEARTISEKVCPECGERMNESIGSYIMECDRCLSKKSE